MRIYAVDAAGNYSKPSNSVTFSLPRDVTPPTAPVVSVTDVRPTHVSLAWSSTEDGPHFWYSLFMDGNRIAYLSANAFSTVLLLEPETTHTFTVQARDFGNNSSPLSQPVTVTTEPANPNDVTPPTKPTNLREDHWDEEIHLSFDQSTDDFDPQWIIRYDVYVNGVLADVTVGRGRSIVYGTFGVINTITVVAIDTAGNASPAATITIPL